MSAATRPDLAAPRRLVAADRPEAERHLLRLNEDDRRMRFLRTMSDAMLSQYAEGIDFDGTACFAIFAADGQLVAMAEGFPERGGAVEAAFTTDIGWRGCGLARSLFDAISIWSTAHGDRRIVLHCDARNRPMRALLRRVDADIDVDGGEVHAVCVLPGGEVESSRPASTTGR